MHRWVLFATYTDFVCVGVGSARDSAASKKKKKERRKFDLGELTLLRRILDTGCSENNYGRNCAVRKGTRDSFFFDGRYSFMPALFSFSATCRLNFIAAAPCKRCGFKSESVLKNIREVG